jgi:hypothetical protein
MGQGEKEVCMKSEKIIINCPNCGIEIEVNEVLYHQLEEQVKKVYEKKVAEREKELQTERRKIQWEKEKIEKEKEKIKEIIDREVKDKLNSEKTKIAETLRKQIENEFSEQMKELQRELSIKSAQVKDLLKAKAEIERLKREKDELREQIILEKEKEFSDRLKEEKIKIQKQIEEMNILKIKEKEKIIEDLKAQLDEAKRKAEQSSMQLQGEVQELELENLLRSLYPGDEIREIKKGQRGADILQVVKTTQGVECGKIYYESKRTKNRKPKRRK